MMMKASFFTRALGFAIAPLRHGAARRATSPCGGGMESALGVSPILYPP